MPDSYQPSERRPLAARSWKVLRWLASALARRGASPNAISVIGMAASLIAAVLLAATSCVPQEARYLWLGAGLLILARALANILDGMVALESNRASRLGELFNEVPDRISDSAMLIGLGFVTGCEPILGFAAALAAVFTAYVRAMAKVAGASQDYGGPMAKPQRIGLVVACCFLGAFSPDIMTRRLDPLPMALPAIVLWLIIAGCLLTSMRRLRRAAAQLRSQIK